MKDWFFPITFLPSIGFFIMATANLSNALSGEIARLIEVDNENDKATIRRKILQLSLLSKALVGLYISAAACALAGLISGLTATVMIPDVVLTVLMCGSILGIIYALALLILFAIRAVSIKKEQFQNHL